MKLLGLIWLILELVVFFWIAHLIGLGWAILIVVLSSLFGGVLMRIAGISNLQRAQQKIMQGEAPTQEMLNIIPILLGGIFMIIPGLLSTVLGLFLLIPGLRNPIINWILRKSTFTMAPPAPKQSTTEIQEDLPSNDGRTIDGEAWKSNDT